MTHLFLYNFIENKQYNKVKQIIHENKTYYQLIIKGDLDKYDKVYFETSPYKCNKCNNFFNMYKKIYVNYFYILQKNLNPYLFSKIIHKLKNYHNLKYENDLIGTHTYWYIHLCHKCYFN